ncbi:MAG TPA: YIP1 family protein, partial [Ktedonobacteraceae bacterium]|nr:YIP1 family protein [Ktedonobacteraceae bacterium]
QYVGFLISPPNSSSITIITVVLLQLVFTPVSFLAAGSILYLIARAFGGRGTFLEQIYTTLLFGVPLVILSYLLLLIPATSSWLPYLPHLYSLVLFAISLMAVHQLSRGKAIAVILIPISILLVLVLVGTTY